MTTLVVSMRCNIYGKEVIFCLSCMWEAVHYFSDISIGISIFLNISEVILLYYLFQYGVEWKANIFIPFHGGYQEKLLMFQHMKCTSGVETVLLNNNFAVVRYAVLVKNSPVYMMGLSPTVRRVRFGSYFGGDNPQQSEDMLHLSLCFQLYWCGA